MDIAIKDMEVGKLYWYSTQQGQYQFKLLHKPLFVFHDGREQWILVVHKYVSSNDFEVWFVDTIVGPDIYGRNYIYAEQGYMGVPTQEYKEKP